jgi:hypothetical protein
VAQATAANLNAQVVGNAASAATDSGNPVKVGSVFNTTQPTVTTGQRVDSQATARGGLIVATGVDAFNITNISGTVSLPTGAATSANQTSVIGTVAAGTAATNSMLTGGVFNTTLPTMTNGQQSANQSDANGRLLVLSANTDGVKATYSATSAIAFASAATATDIFTITGSASKTIRVLRIGFSATQTTAAAVNVLVIKRSTADTGGTSAAATAVPMDSSDAAASATVLNYTANPTPGTSVGTVRAVRAFIPTTALASASQYYEFDFGQLAEKAVVLRGTTQVLALNLNSVTVTGGAWTCWVEWTEE